MAVWSVLAAPLILSADLRNMKEEFKSILQNKAIIEVNQDILGIQGRRIFSVSLSNFFQKSYKPISGAVIFRYKSRIRAGHVEGSRKKGIAKDDCGPLNLDVFIWSGTKMFSWSVVWEIFGKVISA